MRFVVTLTCRAQTSSSADRKSTRLNPSHGYISYAVFCLKKKKSGSGIRGSLYHSHSFESCASRLPGWKIVMPSNALDAYGLILSAIFDPNPVLVLLPKALS